MTLKSVQVGAGKKVNISEIVYIQANANYSILKLLNGNEFIIATTLKKLDEKLSVCGFIRPHKSFLINPQFIVKYDAGALVLIDQTICVCSRRKRQEMDLLLNPKLNNDKRQERPAYLH